MGNSIAAISQKKPFEHIYEERTYALYKSTVMCFQEI